MQVHWEKEVCDDYDLPDDGELEKVVHVVIVLDEMQGEESDVKDKQEQQIKISFWKVHITNQ